MTPKHIPLQPEEFGHVLGTKVDITSYEEATSKVLKWAKEGEVRAVAAANTHLVTESHLEPDFADVLSQFDMILPDGMPLVWSLWLDGHAIQQRVYGPYFMRHVLTSSPEELSHYFFGSTQLCLDRLVEAARRMNPHLKIAGVVSPPFGVWDEAMESSLIADINSSKADIIWIALGGVKQETWIAQHKHRFTRGVFCAVGDAFPLLAGMRSQAPGWMQQSGLTWLYRLAQDPRRLAGRYLKYNSQFVFCYLKDRLKWVYGSGRAKAEQ
jgi:N-acetylglucosaminyldiphosphoundecaprenol N-acetyl-beta-D-mannosaminyltransferase